MKTSTVVRADMETKDLLQAILEHKIYSQCSTLGDLIRVATQNLVKEIGEKEGKYFTSLYTIGLAYPLLIDYFKNIKESGYYKLDLEPYRGREIYYDYDNRVIVLKDRSTD